jgi:large subunit ribosomal protein L25
MIKLSAESREIFGKKLKSLRQQGKMPAVLYGFGEKSTPLMLSLPDFKKIWKEAGESTIIELEIGKNKKNVLIQDVALDPVKDEPLHADFYAVRMDKPIRAEVPLVFSGTSEAVKKGGILVKVLYEIEVECLPKNLPHEVNVDISGLKKLDDQILISDIDLPEGVKPISSLDEVVALVEQAKEEEIPEEKPSIEDIEVVGKEKRTEESEEAKKETGPPGIGEAGKAAKPGTTI